MLPVCMYMYIWKQNVSVYEKAKKMVQFKETAEVKFLKEDLINIEINEEKINRLLHLLHEADPTNLETDTDEMLNLESEWFSYYYFLFLSAVSMFTTNNNNNL